MFKKIVSLTMSALLLLGAVLSSVGYAKDAADEPTQTVTQEKTLVLDASDSKIAKKAGLSRSATFIKSGSYTLYWGGEDIKRSVKLDCAEDWSKGNNLEFWMYSPAKTDSSFAIAVVSDNSKTSCTDFYEVVVRGNYKGWKLFSVPFEEFVPVHTPAGFDKIDRIELWPAYGENTVSEDASYYIDNMYVTNIQSESAIMGGDEVMLYDFTTGLETWSYDTRYPNSAVKKAPDTGEKALWWGDQPRNFSGGVNGITLLPKETDWSFYNTLEINLYSEFDSEATIQIVTASDNPGTASRDYYYEKIAVDWENERTSIQLKIGPSGNQSTGGVPLGWNNITGIELWFINGTDDPSIRTNLYIESIKLKNVDYTAQWKVNQYIEPGPETDNWYDFAAKIDERYPNNQHPRLLVDQNHLDWIKANYKNDKFLTKEFTALLEKAKTVMETNYTPKAAVNAAEASLTLALAYNLTGDQQYKDACWEKVKTYTIDAPTWNTENSRLTLGDVSRPAALTYDLMYKHWNEEERRIARNAMIIHLLKLERATILSTNGADTQNTNWNPIINSGVGMVALAIADEEGYEDASNLVLNRIWRVLPNCFKYFGPDGAGFEGPDYWNYAMANYLLYEAALCSSIGEEDYPLFSVLDEYGMNKTGDFALHVLGSSSTTFNFYDGRARGISCGSDFWLARYFDRPEFAGYIYESGNDPVRSVLMYRPDDRYENWRDSVQLDYSAGGYVQFGAMRASFEKGSQGMYVGYKGNDKNPATHGRLDAGAFVLDSQGTRFIELPSSEDYYQSEMFGALRYTYYRNRGEGSNTLVIGPGVNQNTEEDYDEKIVSQQMDQKYLSSCKIEKTASADGAAYAVVDLTDAYSQTATKVKRGYALINGRDSFLLQDEITTSGTQDVYSFMHTLSDIEIAADGKSAILSKNSGKKLKVSLLSPDNAIITQMAAEPLEESAGRVGSDNSIYKKLAVKTTVSGSATISVLFTPYYGEDNYVFTLDEVIPISRWDDFLLDPVPINGIFLGNTPLSTFKQKQTSYVVNEDSVFPVSATADPGVKIEVTQAEEIGDTALIKATDSQDNTTVYAVSFSADAQTRLDEWVYYAPKGYLYSANKEQGPLAVDGNTSTGWSNAGPQWLALDLGKPKEVSEVLLYWYLQDQRTETFDISVSNDGENWEVVWEGDSVSTKEMGSYKFAPVNVRYVKVSGYKNTASSWTSLMEFQIPSTGSGFSDIEGNWAKLAIEDMAKVGILEGTSDTTFSPDAPLSRAAFITMLERAYSVEQAEYTGNIKDITPFDWYTPYVESAYALGLIPEAMLQDGNFKPNENITREEICALAISFWEKYQGKITPMSLDSFTDKDSISGWAAQYVAKAMAERIVLGVTDTTFEPLQNATRAQAATILKRIYIKKS